MDSVIKTLTEGFTTLNVDPSVKRFATEQLRCWLTDERFQGYWPQLNALIREEAWELLLDCFCRVLPFGTGGRRGPVGLGPNRINDWTIATSVQGHVAYLRRMFGLQERLRVVIAYDVREFRDFRERYVAQVANPLLQLSSRRLAELSAQIYAANDVEVFIQPRLDGRYMSTPELSFAVRFHKAHGGLNVSASHNPPDDNGAKFYNAHGGQFVPPNDSVLTERVEAVDVVQSLSWSDAVASGRLRWLTGDAYNGYLDLVSSQSSSAPKGFSLVFTGLHGAGSWSVPPVLRRAGFEVLEEPSQAIADGTFATVPGRAPNPEIPACLDLATTFADSVGCELVLGTDPDADRIGGCIKDKTGWQFLSGNEIATLVVYQALKKHPNPANAIVMRTEVTTQLVSSIVQFYGAKEINNLLVGFKYIGDGIRQLEQYGVFEGVEGSADDFCIGVEESHGVLTTPELRDKDAAGGALLLAELAFEASQRGCTLKDEFHDICTRHGFVANRLVSTVMRGVTGRQRITAIMESLRSRPPKQVGTTDVTGFTDHQDENGPRGQSTSATDLAARNVLVFQLGSGARLVVRPSGTEPKCKVYGECVASNQGEANELVDQLIELFLDLMLSRIDLELPIWGHSLSDQLPVEVKIDFCTQVFPSLLESLSTSQSWTQEQLLVRLMASGISDVRWVTSAVVRWAQDNECPQQLKVLFGF